MKLDPKSLEGYFKDRTSQDLKFVRAEEREREMLPNIQI